MEFMEVEKALIIPDIHGRTFWKKDTESFLENDKNGVIVFLGDYLDPYEKEGIKSDDAIDNFKKILEFKKEHADNVILLLGNHDLHYIYYDFGECSRYDRWRAKRIGNLFTNDISLFKMAFSIKSGNKKFILSHAGIQKNWVNEFFGDIQLKITDDNVVEFMNAQLDSMQISPDSTFISKLDIMSPIRGGFFYDHGSMVWADCTEYLKPDTEIYGDFQIFGHTVLKMPFIFKNFACLDCLQSFILENGIIEYMDGTPVEIKDFKEKEE